MLFLSITQCTVIGDLFSLTPSLCLPFFPIIPLCFFSTAIFILPPHFLLSLSISSRSSVSMFMYVGWTYMQVCGGSVLQACVYVSACVQVCVSVSVCVCNWMLLWTSLIPVSYSCHLCCFSSRSAVSSLRPTPLICHSSSVFYLSHLPSSFSDFPLL